MPNRVHKCALQGQGHIDEGHQAKPNDKCRSFTGLYQDSHRSASVSSMRDRSSDSDLEKSTKAIRKLYKKQLSKMKPNEIKIVKNELIRTFKENNLIFWVIFLGCRRCSELSEVRRLFGHFFFDWIPFFRRLCSRLGLDYGCFSASPMAALCK